MPPPPPPPPADVVVVVVAVVSVGFGVVVVVDGVVFVGFDVVVVPSGVTAPHAFGPGLLPPIWTTTDLSWASEKVSPTIGAVVLPVSECQST